MKDRFRSARALLSQPPPAGTAGARRPVAHETIADEIDIGVVIVGRPVALEIVEERGPVRLESMHLEIAQRKRKAVVDADQRGHGSASRSTSHSAIPRRVQYLRGDGGGGTSAGGAFPSAR